MKPTHLFFAIFLAALTISCSSRKNPSPRVTPPDSDSIIVRKDFQKYFDDCAVEGSIAIYDNSNQKWILSDTSGVWKETLPASTFKIINLLIALETGIIPDVNAVIKWTGDADTVLYGYRPEIYHDMTAREAFEVSAVWVYIELAKKIGTDNYKKYLASCNYGNFDLSQPGADFWNFGNFGTSPVDQVKFLKKLYESNLPFSKKYIEAVKNVMITEQNEALTIRSKTGWARDKGINTGWWIGYVETNNGVFFFATRLLQDRKLNRDDFAGCRKEITMKILRDLNILE